MSKVFGIGYSRTGTTSLNAALNMLNIKSIHYPGDPETFKLLSNGIVKLPILEEYDAITDIQTVPFYRQFDKEYPGSKFILTVRDVEEWLHSTKKKIRGGVIPLNASGPQWLRTAVYGIVSWNREIYRDRYLAHNAAVIDYFSGRDDLLVIDICSGQGWNALCPFLGKDVPSVRFPTNAKAVRMIKQEWRARGKDI